MPGSAATATLISAAQDWFVADLACQVSTRRHCDQSTTQHVADPLTLGVCRFEGSGLALLQGKAWVAFDNMAALGRLRADLDTSSNSNGDEPVLIGQPAASSQYEVGGAAMTNMLGPKNCSWYSSW
jgi:hypothetical protein